MKALDLIKKTNIFHIVDHMLKTGIVTQQDIITYFELYDELQQIELSDELKEKLIVMPIYDFDVDEENETYKLMLYNDIFYLDEDRKINLLPNDWSYVLNLEVYNKTLEKIPHEEICAMILLELTAAELAYKNFKIIKEQLKSNVKTDVGLIIKDFEVYKKIVNRALDEVEKLNNEIFKEFELN